MKKNKKIVIIMIISILLTFIITKKISKHISESTISAVYALVEKENDMALKNAFLSKNVLNIKTSELLNIIKNNNGEILEVDFDILKCEEIMNYVTKELSNAIKNITEDGYVLYIPIGSAFDSPLLSNLGPRIPVKINLTDIAIGNIRSEIKEYGINNALIELYVDIDVRIAPVVLTKAKVKTKKYSFLLTSKIITGQVPNLYNGKISKESILFDLPVSKNI